MEIIAAGSHKHPQTAAFRTAAEAMHAERYWTPSEKLEERIAFLQALEDVATEVAFQLDRYKVLDRDGLEAYRRAAYIHLPSEIPASAEIFLTFPLARHIANLQMLRDI